MRRHLRNILRLYRISVTLARYRALFPLQRLRIASPILLLLKPLEIFGKIEGRPGIRLARALEQMGPTFIKLGQALSTRPDLIGEDVAEDLSLLRDQLPPFPASQARAIITRELEKPIEALFSYFEDTPVAAASIAQVHLAETREGRKVAVKILRPNLEVQFAQDLDLLFWLAEIVERTLPQTRRLKPIEVVKTFAETVRLEMDLRFEAAAASELRENFPAGSGLVVPGIDWQRTSQRVLTLDWVEGIPISEKEKLIAAGHDMNAILAKASGTLFHQIFRDGFFHADLHPGNMFITPTGDIAVVDFGIMGRLDQNTRLYLADMLYGFLKRDYRRAAKAHFDAGYVPPHKSLEVFAQACRSISEPIFDLPQHEISIARLLSQLFKITKDFEMQTQPQLLLLQKTMMLTEGLGRQLNPNVNMWKLAEPLIEDWVKENMGIRGQLRKKLCELKKLGNMLDRLTETALHLPQIITPEGLRVHPDSIVFLRDKDDPSHPVLWLVIFLAFLAMVTTL